MNCELTLQLAAFICKYIVSLRTPGNEVDPNDDNRDDDSDYGSDSEMSPVRTHCNILYDNYSLCCALLIGV